MTFQTFILKVRFFKICVFGVSNWDRELSMIILVNNIFLLDYLVVVAEVSALFHHVIGRDRGFHNIFEGMHRTARINIISRFCMVMRDH